MAETNAQPAKTLSRGHAFVLAAALCYGLVSFVVGVQVGRRGTTPTVDHRAAEIANDSFLSTLTQPLGAAASVSFDPDPLEAFMEVYEHLRTKYLEPITDKDRQKLAYGAIKGMLRELGDPFTRFMAPDDYTGFREENTGHFKGIGAVLGVDHRTNQIQVIRVFRGNPAQKAGLKPGDYIIGINDEPTDDLSLEVAVNKIRGEAGTKVKLTVRRPDPGAKPLDKDWLKKNGIDPDEPRVDPVKLPGETLDLQVTRDDVKIPIVESEMIGDDIGYLYLQTFNEQSYKQLSESLEALRKKGAKGLILDLRDDPGGMLDECIKVCSMFLTEGAIVHVQERDKAPETLSVIPQYTTAPNLPIVVLVNHFSASASEILSGALQDHKRAILVGATTYGKGLVQTVVPLSDNSAVAITTAKYLTPNKRDINRKGIEPDIPVEWDLTDEQEREALTSNKPRSEWDPQLKRALTALRERLK